MCVFSLPIKFGKRSNLMSRFVHKSSNCTVLLVCFFNDGGGFRNEEYVEQVGSYLPSSVHK